LRSILIRFFLLSILFTLLLIPNRSLALQEKRIALVIGNEDYKVAPLTNSVNDANDMANMLEKCGFEVTKSINATRSQMRMAIRTFGRKIKKGGVGLFYYAGHGIQVKGQNYMVPIGSNVHFEDEVPDECLLVSSVLRKMDSAENRVNILILDACRNNPFARSFRSTSRGLARVDAPKGSIIAYATAPNSVALDRAGKNGLYTSKLLKHMMTPKLPIELFFKNVRVDVANASGGNQIPWTESSLMGEFFFIVEDKTERAKVPLAKTNQELMEDRKSLKQMQPKSETVRTATDKNDLKLKSAPSVKENVKLSMKEPSGDIGAIVVGRDDHFAKLANGIIHDSKTGLEWIAGPDRDMSWYEVEEWANSLEHFEGGGWQMPSLDQLMTLYEKGKGTRNITPLLKTNGWFVWSRDIKDPSSAWQLLFHNGNKHWKSKKYSFGRRGFVVRAGND
jgi:hypothetical protein